MSGQEDASSIRARFARLGEPQRAMLGIGDYEYTEAATNH